MGPDVPELVPENAGFCACAEHRDALMQMRALACLNFVIAAADKILSWKKRSDLALTNIPIFPRSGERQHGEQNPLEPQLASVAVEPFL